MQPIVRLFHLKKNCFKVVKSTYNQGHRVGWNAGAVAPRKKLKIMFFFHFRV